MKYLECQDCGERLRRLSEDERDAMAENPYAYVVYCFQCAQYRKRAGA